MPPPLPFGRTALHGVIRVGTTETLQVNAVRDAVISWADILTGVWSNLRTLFAEIKLLRVNVWVMPSASFGATGLQCLIVCPASEFIIPNGKVPKFTNLGTVPGSVVRKVYQTVHREWHPTSPFERGWHKTDSTDALFHFLHMTNDMKKDNGISGNDYKAEVIWDYHIRARGFGSSSFLASSFEPQQIEGEEGVPYREASVAIPSSACVRLSDMDLADDV